MKFSSQQLRFAAAFFLAVLLAGLVTAILWALTPTAYFEASMSSSADGGAQVFYDVGRGFNEADSTRLSLQGLDKTAIYRFPLPPGSFGAFRLDPIDHGNASITIDSTRVVDAGGRSLRDFSPSEVVGTHDIAKLNVSGHRISFILGAAESDPSLTVSLPQRLVLTAASGKWSWAVRLFLLWFSGLLAFGLLAVWLSPHVRSSGGPFCLRVASWSRQRPRRALLLGAAVSVVVSCYPVVFLGKTFATASNAAMLYAGPHIVPGDVDTEAEDFKGSDNGAMVWQNLPYSFVQSRGFFKYGELPLWNRFNSCGTPLLAQGLTMSGDPLQVIPLLAGGASWAWDIKFLVAKIFFCWGIGLTVLASRRSLAVATLLGCSAAFIGFFSWRFDHPAFFSMCYAPWILLGWIEVARARTRRSIIAWVLVIVMASWAELNSGTAKESSMLLLTLHGCGFLAFLLASRNRLTKLIDLSLGGLAFVLIAAPVWLTFWEALRESYVPYKDAAVAFQIQPGLLAGFFDEVFYRAVNPGHGVFNPSANFLVLLGCLLALVYLRKLMQDPVFLAVGLSALLCASLVFGVIPPALIKEIPMLKNVWHVDNTFSCPLIIELFVMAGFGLEAWRRYCVRKGWKRDLVLCALPFFAVLGSYLGLTDAGQRAPIDFAPLGNILGRDTFFYVYSLSLIVAIFCFPWVVARMIRRRHVSLFATGVALACLTMLHWRHGFQARTHIEAIDDYTVNPSARLNLRTPSPAIEFLKSQPGPFRTAGFEDVFFPGYPMIAELESIYGTDPLMNLYYRELLLGAGIKLEWSWRWVVEKTNLNATGPVYNLLNIAYFLAKTPEPAPAGNSLSKSTSLDLVVYKNNNVWPRAFFSEQVRSYDTVDQLVGMVREHPDQPLAAVQKGEVLASVQANTKPENSVRVTPAHDYRLTNNTTTFTIDATGPGVAVLTEAYLQNDLIAWINGSRAKYFRVNHAFRGVEIPKAGSYVITFSYWPKHFTRSLWMALGGVILLGAWLTLAWRRERLLSLTAGDGHKVLEARA